VATEAASVRAAFRFAADEGRIEKMPTFRFEKRNGNAEEPETYTNEELRRIRDFIMDDLEDAIFHLLAYTGCRRDEIVNLTWEDVDFEGKTLSVLGKFRKRRTVPIHPVLLKLLRQRRTKYPDSTAVLGAGGSSRNVNARLSALLKRAGVDGGNRPAHAFRKTVASELSEAGVPTNNIDKILGWSPPTVRERYYTRTDPNLYDAILTLYAADPIERPAAKLHAA
jgi:integrase